MKKFFALLLLLPFAAAAQGPVRRVETVADLADIKPLSSAVSGKLTVTLAGYYAAGDFGAERILHWDSSSAAAVDNGCVFAVAAGGGRFIADDCGGGSINVKWFGAVGDGATTDSSAIQAAITAAASRNAAVFFPPGTFKLTTGLTGGSNTRLLGEGATLLTETNTYCLTISAGATNVLLSSLNFNGNSLASRVINIATNAQVRIDNCTMYGVKEDVSTPAGALGIVARSGVDLVVQNSYFHHFYTSTTNGAGDAPGMSRAIYVTTQASADEPPPKRVLVTGCRFEQMYGTEDSDAIVVQGGSNWTTNNCGVAIIGNTFLGVGKRAAKLSAGGSIFSHNYYSNNIALTSFGGAIVSIYANNCTIANNVLIGGNYYSAVDIGVSTDYSASGFKLINNTIKTPSGLPYYTNGVAVLVVGKGIEGGLIEGNDICFSDIDQIRVLSGGAQIKIVNNKLQNVRKATSPGYYGNGIFLGLSYGALAYDPAYNVEIVGNTFCNFSQAVSMYGGFYHTYKDNQLIDTPTGLYWADTVWLGGPTSTNGVAATNLFRAEEWSWYTKRNDWWNGARWMHDASYSEARSAAGGVTNGQWYRIAYMTQPTNVSTHPRGGARIIIGNQGGSLEPTRTVFEVDHGFSGLGSVSLIHNVPDTDAPWRAIRVGYRDDSTASSNKTAFVDVQANATSAGAFTVLVEAQPVVAYPETAYQWYATNAPISALATNEYSFCTMTNVHMLSSGFQRYSGFQYEDYALGPLWQLPRWSTTERNAFTHQRAGSLGWNTNNLQIQVYDGSSWVPVGAAYLNKLSDVNTNSIAVNSILKWNGTNWIMGVDQSTAGTNKSEIYFNTSTLVSGPSINDSPWVKWYVVGTNVTADHAVMVGDTNSVLRPNFTGIPGTSVGYYGIASASNIIFMLYDKAVAITKLSTNGATSTNQIIKFNGTDWAIGVDNVGSGGGSTNYTTADSQSVTNFQSGTNVKLSVTGQNAVVDLHTNISVPTVNIGTANFSNPIPALVITNATSPAVAGFYNYRLTNFSLGKGLSNSAASINLEIAPGTNITFSTNQQTITINSTASSSAGFAVNGSGAATNITNSSSIAWSLSGGVATATLTNDLADGYYGFGWLPLHAGLSNALSGNLHFQKSSDIRLITLETGQIANSWYRAFGTRSYGGKYDIGTFNTNDFTFNESWINFDPSVDSGNSNVITFGNSGYNNQVVFDAPVVFNGTVSGLTVSNNTGYSLFFTETNVNGTTAYTTNTFTVPTNQTMAHCWIVGLGGGGGSGRVGPTNTVNAGGAGGGGGARYYYSWPVSNLLASSPNMTVLVPNRLPGGAPAGTNSSNGNAGDGDGRFVYVYSGTNLIALAQSGGAGAGGTATGASAGGGGGGMFVGAAGSAASATGGAGSNGPQLSSGGASGGASGGGLNVANAASSGGTGAGAGWPWNGGGGGSFGTSPGGVGGDGSLNTGFEWLLKGGPSGGGGGSNPSGNGGAGGAGGYFGGGGGGGGGSQDGYYSGAGGPGGPAGVLIIFK